MKKWRASGLVVAGAAAAAAAVLSGCGVNSDVAQAHETSGAQGADAQVDRSHIFLRNVYVQPDAKPGPVLVATVANASTGGHGSDRLSSVSTPAAAEVRPVRMTGSASGASPSGNPSPATSSASPRATPMSSSPAQMRAGSSSRLSARDLRIAPLSLLHFVDPTVQHSSGPVLRIIDPKHTLHNGTAIKVRFSFANAGSQTALAPVVADPGTTKLHSRSD